MLKCNNRDKNFAKMQQFSTMRTADKSKNILYRQFDQFSPFLINIILPINFISVSK